MEQLLAPLTSPISQALQIVLLVLLYVLFYLMLEAFDSKRMNLYTTILLFLLLMALSDMVVEAFVTLHNLASVFSAFFLALIPIVTSVLVVMQSVLSLIAWSPVVIFIIELLVYICGKLLIPGLVLSVLLDVCTRILPEISFAKAAELIRKVILSLITAAIIGLTSILSFSSVAFYTLNEALASPIKKIIEQNIPIIGSLLVQGISLLKKFQSTATTLTGLSTISTVLVIAFYPALTLLIYAFTFKFVAAVSEPFTNSRISGLLDDIGKSLLILCAVAILLAVGFIVVWLLLFLMLQIGMGKSL